MSTTRLLILGALRFMQPTHGYDVRRELESWRVDQWANVAYGSIYFALNKMAEEGLVTVVEAGQTGRGPARTTYAVTEGGEAEFQRLLREYWWGYKRPVDPFYGALSFMDALPHDELLAALRHRVSDLRADIARLAGDMASVEFLSRTPGPDVTPRHVVELLRLAVARLEAEVRWAEDVIAKVERGDSP